MQVLDWLHSFSCFIIIWHYSSQISITSPVIWIHSDFYFNSYQKHSFYSWICKFSDWIFYRTRGPSISEMISDLGQFYRICPRSDVFRGGWIYASILQYVHTHTNCWWQNNTKLYKLYTSINTMKHHYIIIF